MKIIGAQTRHETEAEQSCRLV